MIPKSIIEMNLAELETIKTDVVIVGSGIAGLYTAIKASEHADVLVIAKSKLTDSNTKYAQGGIAAVLSENDSPLLHLQDTLQAGAGLCVKEAAEVLVNEGPEVVRELIDLGTQFDQENGKLALTKEGAHSKRRILHALGDATGSEIVRALSQKVIQNNRIEVWDDHFAIDLVTNEAGCHGALVQNEDGSRFFVQAKATVLSTGGAGQLYRYTTNPSIATGDGVAMAYRAGAEIQDMEFVQFHPTALCHPDAPRFLISEAVRGEGAVLRNVHGERFMEKVHPQLELAPRDVVARAIVTEMEETASPYVYLDFTHEHADKIKRRFPTIYRFCLQYGLDLTTDLIPVAPAAHYMMGGVKTDLNGQTTIARLFACGEVASTGVHGANRLASNSLLEAVVFGRRIAEQIKHLSANENVHIDSVQRSLRHEADFSVKEVREKLQNIMLEHVGVKRHQAGLEKAYAELSRMITIFQARLKTREQYECANLLTCALVTTESALLRKESRGGHYRLDYPARDDQHWLGHTIVKRKRAFEGVEMIGQASD